MHAVVVVLHVPQQITAVTVVNVGIAVMGTTVTVIVPLIIAGVVLPHRIMQRNFELTSHVNKLGKKTMQTF